MQPAGAVSVALSGKPYAGLALCSHDSTVAETALFSNVGFSAQGMIPDDMRVLESTLEIIEVA